MHVPGNPAAGREHGTANEVRDYFNKCVANRGNIGEQPLEPGIPSKEGPSQTATETARTSTRRSRPGGWAGQLDVYKTIGRRNGAWSEISDRAHGCLQSRKRSTSRRCDALCRSALLECTDSTHFQNRHAPFRLERCADIGCLPFPIHISVPLLDSAQRLSALMCWDATPPGSGIATHRIITTLAA